LTPARQSITPECLYFFYKFCTCNDVYLVTGSDREKTIEQVTQGIYNQAKRVYNCSGSDVYEGDLNVYRDDWELPQDVERHLENELLFSKFPVRNGTHIERRPGGVNFSILGRGSTCFVEREEYMLWDKTTNERAEIARRLKIKFPDLEVNIGGQTGLDLGAPGSNKSQILRDFRDEHELYFFGDMMEEGQNDYALAKAVQDRGGYSHCVKDWQDTIIQLNKIESP
jgi:phosphomannomutase